MTQSYSYFRYLAGQKEYEVELQFSSGMLSYPDRVNTGGEEYRDGEYPVPGSLPDLHSEGSQQYVIYTISSTYHQLEISDTMRVKWEHNSILLFACCCKLM